MSLEPGASVGRYKILALVGAGGMGEIYRAEDTTLERVVALKVLPESASHDQQSTNRLVQEAKAASAVNHQNVAHIYEIESSNRGLFIAMEYVEGNTLDVYLKEKQIPANLWVDFAIQIVEGLAEAHSKGITHRDIKPANLMVTPRGQIKILDFGLAKGDSSVRSAAASQSITVEKTKRGVLVGTVPYMSPEQALGRSVDHRTDIFSTGAVLFQMAAGRIPFTGSTTGEILDAIIHSEPPAASNLTPEMDRITRKCLEKDADKRYQSAAELLVDLKRLRDTIGPTPSRWLAARSLLLLPGTVGLLIALLLAYDGSFFSKAKTFDSIAILPFENAGNDPDLEFLSDGMTEALIDRLSHLGQIKVMARNTVFHYKGKTVDARKVGKDLRVGSVLTGRVQQNNEKLIVHAELIDTSDGARIWGKQYERKTSEILVVQQELSRDIAANLHSKLTGEQKAMLSKNYTDNSEAFQLYLKGRYFWNKRSMEGLKKAVDYFQQALDKDPLYAPAYAGLADSYYLLTNYFQFTPEHGIGMAKAFVSKALEIDESMAEAHASLGAIKQIEWDWPSALIEFRRAIELNPNSATAHQWYGEALALFGRSDEAVSEIKRARELDPLSLIIHTAYASTFYDARRYDDAILEYSKVLEMDPNYLLAHDNLAYVYYFKGMYREAAAEFKKLYELSGRQEEAAFFANIPDESSYRSAWKTKLQYLKKQSAQGKFVSEIVYVQSCLHAGENEEAMLWLQKAHQQHAAQLEYIAIDPIYDPLRGDPRFQSILRSMRLQ